MKEYVIKDIKELKAIVENAPENTVISIDLSEVDDGN